MLKNAMMMLSFIWNLISNESLVRYFNELCLHIVHKLQEKLFRNMLHHYASWLLSVALRQLNWTNACRGRRQTYSTGAGTGDMTTVAMVAKTDNGTGEFKTVCCLLNNVNVNLIIDLRAKVSLINQVIYNKSFSNIKLERSNVRLTSYDGMDIESLECLYVLVQYKSNTLQKLCFHMLAEGQSIMGVDLFDALGFKVFNSVGKYIISDNDPDKRTTV